MNALDADLLRASARPLGLREDHGLPDDQRATLQRIEDTDVRFVEERILRKGALPPERLPRAILEMKRYLALKALGRTGMELIDDDADVAWHNYILFTREYRAFCDAVCGRYIDHEPFTGATEPDPLAPRRFRRNYAALFGPWRADRPLTPA